MTFPKNNPFLQSLLETGGGGGGVFGAVDRTANGSPAAGWGRSASPRRAPAPATNSNMWGSGVGGEVGWDHGPSLAHGAQLVPQLATHSTNPFGTSPSNPPYHAPGNFQDHSYFSLNRLFIITYHYNYLTYSFAMLPASSNKSVVIESETKLTVW